jgi:hypothetical protein
MEGTAMFESKETTPKTTVERETKIVPAYLKQRSHAGVLFLVLLLALAVAGTGWYMGHRQDRQEAQLAKLPGVQASLDGLKSRFDATEAGLRDWSDRWSTMDTRLAKVENRAGTLMATAGHETAKVFGDLQSQMDTRFRQVDDKQAAINTRLDQMESTNRLQRVELDRLRRDVGDSQKEVADLRSDTTQDITAVRAANDETADRLNNRVGQLENARQKQRVDFEISNNRSSHLLPGVTLAVESIDATHQRYNGYLWLLEDRRTVWIRNQDAQVPVLIYPKAGGQPLRLVVNQVTPHDVAGYLLIPVSQLAYGQAGTVTSPGDGGGR